MSNEDNNKLSDEFKNEINKSGSQKNILGTLLALLAVFLVFGTIGVAGYELIFKPETIEQKSSGEKIESRPQEDEKTETVVTQEESSEVPKAQEETKNAEPEFTEYTVVSGDTYSSIANANDMSSADLMSYNGVSGEDLQIGQVIKIPKK